MDIFQQPINYKTLNDIIMKNLTLLTLAVFFALFSYGQEESKKYVVEINYFHRTERCKTCNSIEANIEKVIKANYADEIELGELVFTSIDYQAEEVDAKVEKYEVDAPTLVITRIKKGKETTKDLTKEAFDKSLNEGAAFRKILEETINEMFR
jgi:hypothetical protein